MKILQFTTAFVAILAISLQVNAAPISWGAVDGDTTAGDLIGGPTITFTAAEYPGGNAAGTFFTGGGGDTGNADLNTVYDSHGWEGAGATITIEGLSDGADYTLQLLGAGDTRDCCATRSQAGDDGAGNVSGDFYRGNSSLIGTFTASGATQDVMIVSGTDNGVDPGLSGYIVADAAGAFFAAINYTNDGAGPTVTVPEPNSIVMVLFGGLALLFRRRR